MTSNMLSLAGIIVTVIGWIGFILWRVFWGGKAVGESDEKLANLRQDIQQLHEIISVNNDMQNERYHDFYKEFNTLRLKIAKELGINGSN